MEHGASLVANSSKTADWLPQMLEALPVTVRYFRKCGKYFLSPCDTSANVGSTSRRRAMLLQMLEALLVAVRCFRECGKAPCIAVTSFSECGKHIPLPRQAICE